MTVLTDMDLATFNSSHGYKINGDTGLDFASSDLASGDVDGDGRAEIIVGAYKYVERTENPWRRHCGRVYVINGTNTESKDLNPPNTSRCCRGRTQCFVCCQISTSLDNHCSSAFLAMAAVRALCRSYYCFPYVHLSFALHYLSSSQFGMYGAGSCGTGFY